MHHDDVVPRITVRTFPNQKPWVNGEVRAKLKARTDAYNSGDLEEYRKVQVGTHSGGEPSAAQRDSTRSTRAPTPGACPIGLLKMPSPSPSTLPSPYLDQRDTYVRMLFIDYSSAFNTIVPSKLSSSPSSETSGSTAPCVIGS
ncbi:hypothetical protein L3Q82_022333 [Scortum barcoo]|uniref:Uncharacterized protein n=1 Tax=Scortum barcoo TaxID=214431 RepID=A0ACB8X0Y9_9TELE|nr:hypothetical protein L3Q82_022333 [Scortum barcoo]